MLSRRGRRRGERGQVLIMALAFILFFGLVTAAVLQLADTVEVQQAQNRAGVTAHANAEGGMLFAAQAAQDQGGCVPTTHGSMTMTSGASASYTTTACNPGATADLIGDQCGLCVLGQSGVATALSVQGTLTVQGPIAVGGDASSTGPPIRSTVPTSTGTNPGFIACTTACGPSRTTDYSPAAGTLTRAPAPSVTAPSPANGGCRTNYVATQSADIPQGCYASIDLECQATFFFHGPCQYTLDPGTFVLDGPFTIDSGTGWADSVSVVAHGPVLLEFAQGTDGNPGGSLLVGSDNSLSILDGTGRGDIAVDVEQDDSAGAITIDDGGSLSVDGTVYAPDASVAVHGGPGFGNAATLTTAPTGADPDSGRLIVGSMDIGQHGVVSVTSMPPGTGYCWVYDDSVSAASGGTTSTGQVVVESDCSGVESTGIISISYGS
jgi:hypothetical protein